jgi:hypothetical protein
MARWTTDNTQQRKHLKRVKTSLHSLSSNKCMRGFKRLPKGPATTEPTRMRPNPWNQRWSQNAETSHHLGSDDVAHFYAKEAQQLAKAKRQIQRPVKTLKGRGFSAVAQYAWMWDYTQWGASEKSEPKPMKYDYTKMHASWVAKLAQREREANVFRAFQGSHIRVADDSVPAPPRRRVPEAKPGTQIYVGSVPESLATEEAMGDLLCGFGELTFLRIHWSNPKWSYFVLATFTTAEEATKAVEALNGRPVSTGVLTADVRNPPPSSTPPAEEPTPQERPSRRRPVQTTPVAPDRPPPPRPLRRRTVGIRRKPLTKKRPGP